MKKYIILTLILIIFVFNIDIVITSTKDASILFFNKIFITIFPFIILCDILIYYDYHILIKNSYIGKIISKIFNIDSNSSIIFILSILTSQPNNSIYIKSMLDNNEIDIDTANKILCFTYFPSISFVIGTIGILLYKNSKIGLILYLNCLLNNILIGIYLRKNKYKSTNILKRNKVSFFAMLKNSINKAINNSFLILGNLIIFSILINLIDNYTNTSNIINSILYGILELTNGIVYTNGLNINLISKLLITSFILNFSGLSIIFQSISILSEYKINIKKILIIKLIFSLLTTILLSTPLLLLNLK